MTIDLFGFSIYEFAVSITDLLLFAESSLFATILYQTQSSQLLFRRLLVLLFLALAASSLFGAIFHAFFPLDTGTAGGFFVWMLVANSIGVIASTLWAINALAFMGVRVFKITLPLVAIYNISFIYTMFFIDSEFETIILFYAPPLIVLALVALTKSLRNWDFSWGGVFAGVILSFAAATAQYLKISPHPEYFDHNALYHLIQATSLAVLFLSFRAVLKGA